MPGDHGMHPTILRTALRQFEDELLQRPAVAAERTAFAEGFASAFHDYSCPFAQTGGALLWFAWQAGAHLRLCALMGSAPTWPFVTNRADTARDARVA